MRAHWRFHPDDSRQAGQGGLGHGQHSWRHLLPMPKLSGKECFLPVILPSKACQSEHKGLFTAQPLGMVRDAGCRHRSETERIRYTFACVTTASGVNMRAQRVAVMAALPRQSLCAKVGRGATRNRTSFYLAGSWSCKKGLKRISDYPCLLLMRPYS